MTADQSRVPLAILYDAHKDSVDVLTALCKSRAPVRCAVKRSKRQFVINDEPDVIDFKRIRLETDSHSDENGKAYVPQKPMPIQMQGPARCTQCGQLLGPWHDLAGCWVDVRSGGPTIAAATLMLDVRVDEDILMTEVNASNNQQGAFGSPVFVEPGLSAQSPWV
ncbi:hypothetical protein COCOBI_06-4900 [Coccomyxa sp. Obi]|nr:hypothetical protein COCOBI_06-4900 [Coccomyxa sp. Obi]